MSRAKVYHKRGGAELVVESGGKISVASGGAIEVTAGATITGIDGAATFASVAEVQAGVVENKNVSPATLAACTATEGRKGVAELATAAEALAGTDTDQVVPPAGLQGSIANVELIAFAGAAAAGPCTATGLKAGDLVLSVTGIAAGTVGDQSGKFEATISVNDQIHQSDSGNLSANIYLALVHRKS